MSKEVEERVLEMRFDNSQFERNVSQTMSTLDRFKQKLNFAGAHKGLETIGAAAQNVNMSGLGAGVEEVRARFSALQVAGVTALTNIANSAYQTGVKMAKALTIDPITTGFNEYETQINAVQTILANTKSKGTTIDDVNGALDELNTYADKTIYNFTEMTRNIGTFTAAGVDLDKSVTSIKGIANLAAVSGSSSQQASTAMYQLSQALAAGKVQLMDWNSVVNAGMGGQVFQDALKRTAKNMGHDVDGMIKKYGSFRESLTKGEWLTADVLTETLTQLSGAYTEADLISQGYTKKQAQEILELADTAEQAATKVKTFTQLWDTLKEAAQSGWTQTWEIIVGDFEEAKSMLTNISDTLGAVIGASAEARNELLQGWKDAGGRSDLIDGFANIYEALKGILKPINEAFREIFPPITVEHLVSFTKRFKEFTENLIIGSKTADSLKRIFKGVFSVFDIGRKVLMSIADAIANLLGSDGVASLGTFLLDTLASLGDFFTSLNERFDTDGFSGVLSGLVTGISDLLVGATGHLEGFGDVLTYIGDIIASVAGKIWNALKTVFGWITENISAGDIFAGLAGGGIFMASKKISGFIDNIVDAVKGLFGKESGLSDLKEKFGDILGSVHDSLNAFSTGVKISSLVSIAIAVGILSASLKTISKIDAGNIVKSLMAIGSMLGMLSWTMKSVTKSLGTYGSSGVVKAGFSLMLVAGAISILANAMEKISKMPLKDIGKGLVGIAGGLIGLSAGLKIIGKTKISLSTSVAMMALAVSCNILGDALKKFGGLSWDEIKRGLVGMGGALTEFVAAMVILNKFGGGKSIFGSIGILIAVQSLKKMADGLKSFAEMTWDEIKRGLAGMGGALAELGIVIGGLGKFAGFSSIFSSGAITIVIQGLDDLAEALKKFGEMTWDEIKHGLVGMGGALTEVATVTGILGKLTGFSGILGGGSILIAVQSLGDIADALKKFGEMTWDEIKRGLVGMGGALGEIAIVSGTLGGLTGFAGLIGSGSILLAVQGLGDIADALKKFGEMSWDEIKQGLAAMGGALGEIALGGFLSTLSGIGALAISEIASSLGTLADSVKKWKDVSVPEILGVQLGSLANGVEKFTLAGMGASALSEASASLGVMADSVKKWVGVTVPEGLGTKLKSLADGVEKFTLSGLGASALADAAPAVGTLATSIKKWKDVSVPENLESDLSSIAKGVKAFSFAFAGGWSMSALVKPLGELPASIKKWSDVTIPEGLESSLKFLASGVKAFSFAFVGGWSMETVIGPLASLPDSIKKWNGVTIPEGLGASLKSLADGIRPFATMGDISGASTSVSILVSSVKNLSEINISGISSKMDTLAESIVKLGSSSSISANINGLGQKIVNGLLAPIKNASGKFTSAGANMILSIAKGSSTKQAALISRLRSIMASAINTVTSYQPRFQVIGITLMSRFINGVISQRAIASSILTSVLATAVTTMTCYYQSFYSAGSYLVDGFAAGISANSFKAEAKAKAMAEAAEQAAKEALDINSPSKVFRKIGMSIPEGFIAGITKLGGAVSRASSGMTDASVDTVKNAIGNIANLLGSDVDMNPTIRPVLDLTDIRSGASELGSMFGSPIGTLSTVGTINSMMNGRIQNGAESEVVSAINKLRKDLGNATGDTYNFNGLTYSGDAELDNAFKTIVRYAKLERRV